MKKVCAVKTWLIDNFWVLIVAVAAGVMAGLLELVSWNELIWCAIAIGVLICIVFWIAGKSGATKAPNLERMSLEELVTYASKGAKGAKKAKEAALDATEAEVANHEVAKAKAAVKITEKAASEMDRRIAADPTNVLLTSTKTIVDGYKTEAEAAAREAENALVANSASSEELLGQKLLKALEKKATAENSCALASSATDSSCRREEIEKAEEAAEVAKKLADEAEAIANAESKPAYLRIAEMTRNAARAAATAATNARKLLGTSALSKMTEALNELLLLESKVTSANAAITSAATKADAQPEVQKAKEAATAAQDQFVEAQSLYNANRSDTVIQHLFVEAERLATAISTTATAAETRANSKP